MLGCLLLIIIIIGFRQVKIYRYKCTILFRGYLGPDGGEDPFSQHHVLLLSPAGIQALTTLYTKVIFLHCPNETYCCVPPIENSDLDYNYDIAYV